MYVHYAAQLALIIETMQYTNVMHRDLKPENIMIDDFDFLKVVRTRSTYFRSTSEALSSST
jgi:serine/threonine protein kinase